MLKVEKILLADIVPYTNNAKLHPAEQVRAIAHSIEQFGNNDPIAIDENNVIIEGHGRYQALLQLGYTEAEVIRLTGLSEEQKNAYRLAHNQLTMNTDWDMVRLEEELRKLADMVFTDPPYGMNRLDELNDIFRDVDESQRRLVQPLLYEVVELEERMRYLKTLPFIAVHPQNASLQKMTPAAKLYKECSQSYMNAIRILCSILHKAETSAQDELLRRLEEFA